MDELLNKLGDLCHEAYLGSQQNKATPDGFEYCYQNEVVNLLLDDPRVEQAVARYVEQEKLRARVDELSTMKQDAKETGRYTENTVLGLAAEIDERIAQLEKEAS